MTLARAQYLRVHFASDGTSQRAPASACKHDKSRVNNVRRRSELKARVVVVVASLALHSGSQQLLAPLAFAGLKEPLGARAQSLKLFERAAVPSV